MSSYINYDDFYDVEKLYTRLVKKKMKSWVEVKKVKESGDEKAIEKATLNYRKTIEQFNKTGEKVKKVNRIILGIN